MAIIQINLSAKIHKSAGPISLVRTFLALASILFVQCALTQAVSELNVYTGGHDGIVNFARFEDTGKLYRLPFYHLSQSLLS
jgi:hypothetical protein